MDPVEITVQNLSSTLTDEAASTIVDALNTQVTRDYGGSCWVTQDLAAPATVKFIGKGETIPADTWHVELLDTSDQPGALGYHEDVAFDNKVNGEETSDAGPTQRPRKASTHSSRGLRADAPEIPLAKVFVKTAKEDGAAAGEVASHEILEMLVDPQVMKTPRTVTDSASEKIYIVEVGDPVQECGYMIGEVEVADFALPAWFGLPQHANPTQMSFRSSVTGQFELAPGGYISLAPVSDPESWTQIFGSAGGA
jgi:hypothetical protein